MTDPAEGIRTEKATGETATNEKATYYPYGTARYAIRDANGEDTGGTLWMGAVVERYPERTRWDGSHSISLSTGRQWDHEDLVRTRRGRYYVIAWSQWADRTPYARALTTEEAARWLVRCGYDAEECDDPVMAARVRTMMEDA